MRAPKARSWCFTINNPTPADYEELATVKCKYIIYGNELAPTTGTPHVQGYIQFANPATVKLTRSHNEIAKGTPEQNITYCKKEGDYIERGELPGTDQGKRKDILELVTTITEGERNPKKLRALHPEVCAKYPGFVQQLCIDHTPKPSPPDICLRPWQEDIIQTIKLPAPDRVITFIVDPTGNGGKTTFANYVDALFENVQVMKPGRYQDMAYELIDTTRILIMDCPRCRTDVIQYQFLEDIKDGRVTNSKYQSYQKRLGPCHVIVLMNEMPDRTKLSEDRINIVEL